MIRVRFDETANEFGKKKSTVTCVSHLSTIRYDTIRNALGYLRSETDE